MNETAQIIGYMVALSSGVIVVICAFFMLCWFSGIMAAETFKRLQRTYHLSVIGYWLDRLEKGGMREFHRAEQHDKNVKAVKSTESNKEQA